MAYIFGDSFDLYATTADVYGTGYWDSGSSLFTLQSGRFGGQCARVNSTGSWMVKSSGANDAVHHIVCAYQQSAAALTGTTLGVFLQLSDGATNQCCIVFRQDGAILLTSAIPAGTVLATYTGAVTLINQWFAFEFEVVIHPTAGRFRVRKNNNTVDDFDSGATLPTRPGANSYANKLTLGSQSFIGYQHIDDLLWRSDASSVPFVGDIRTYVRMPTSDASVVFSRLPAYSQTPYTNSTTNGFISTVARLTGAITVAVDGAVGSIQLSMQTGYTANVKCSIWQSVAGTPAAVLASATPLAVLANGMNTFTFPTPLNVTKGQIIHVGFMADTNGGTINVGLGNSGWQQTSTTYAAFPVASPSVSVANAPVCTIFLTPNTNYGMVNEAQQDSATSYVYSSNVGDTDLYGIGSIAVTPASTVAVTTRAFVTKSDAGSRSGKVLLKSGSTMVDSGSATLATTWQQMWRTDTVDPATGAAWTPTGVNAVNVGVQVAS